MLPESSPSQAPSGMVKQAMNLERPPRDLQDRAWLFASALLPALIAGAKLFISSPRADVTCPWSVRSGWDTRGGSGPWMRGWQRCARGCRWGRALCAPSSRGFCSSPQRPRSCSPWCGASSRRRRAPRRGPPSLQPLPPRPRRSRTPCNTRRRGLRLRPHGRRARPRRAGARDASLPNVAPARGREHARALLRPVCRFMRRCGRGDGGALLAQGDRRRARRAPVAPDARRGRARRGRRPRAVRARRPRRTREP